MLKLKRKGLLTVLLVLGLMVSSISMVFAGLETFLVQGNDGSYYEYNSGELDASYLAYQINPNLPGAAMYKHFVSIGGKVVGLKDSQKGYIDFQAAQAASLLAQIKGQAFDLNSYLISPDAKALEGAISGVKQVDKDGNVTEENGLPKASVKFYASLVPGMKIVLVTLDTDSPQDYSVTYDGINLTYNDDFGGFKAEVATTVSERLTPVVAKIEASDVTVQFFDSLTPGLKTVVVKLSVEDPTCYTVSYGDINLVYDSELGAFTAEIVDNVSETLKPVVTKIELPEASVSFYVSLTPGMKTVLVTLDTSQPSAYSVTYNGTQLVYDEDFGGYVGELPTNVSQTLEAVVTKL